MNDEEYYNFVRPYADAMQMLLTRLDVLNHNLYGKSDSRPIHYIQNRIKKKKSLEEEEIIVVAGRGAQSETGVALCRELADALGGQLAFTRPMVEKNRP